MASRPRTDGLRLTKVGLWFLIFLAIVLLAAVNTGNNGLFLAMAVMASALLVSQLTAWINVRGLAIRIRPPAEIFAQSPARLEVEVENRSRWLPRWLLVLGIDDRAQFLVPHLARRETSSDGLELLLRRRGRHRLPSIRVTSLFPLGFFRKRVRYPQALELLVFPEIFSPPASWPTRIGKAGAEPTRRAGWGHDLFGLRTFRYGDDPRGIHWKQTARTGTMIFTEREHEENRRLLIVIDNAVGALTSAAGRRRFERLVSEAATAALDYLASGHEVALLTREGFLPFTSGARQRHAILETLALIKARPTAARPLVAPEPEIPHLRLVMGSAGGLRVDRAEELA